MTNKPATTRPNAKRAPGSTPSRRRPASGGYARSEETRAGLIAAALDVFGNAGFASASTRAIARRANVTLPVLAYHFGSKEGLYLACAEHIAAQISARMASGLQSMHAKLAVPDPSHEELMGLLLSIMNAFVDIMVGTVRTRSWSCFIIREQVNPTAAFDILYACFMSKCIGACAEIIARLLGLPADDPQVRLRALTCVGQVLIFRSARTAALRTLGWQDFEGEHLDEVRKAVHAQVKGAFAASRTSDRAAS